MAAKEWSALSTTTAQQMSLTYSAAILGPNRIFTALAAKCHSQLDVNSRLTYKTLVMVAINLISKSFEGEETGHFIRYAVPTS